MSGDFKLIMIGAMYENGGNTTHRFLDGHPQLFVYPFESQLGTRFVSDALSSMFPAKYRWPEFPLDGTPDEDFRAIIDEECKVRARTPLVSKFRTMPFDFSDEERREHFVRRLGSSGRSRSSIVTAFIQATFDAWRDRVVSGRESVYVGYSPIVTVDADRILSDLSEAHLIHVVRNPWSAFADTKRRPLPMALSDYMLAWALIQHAALVARERWPERVHILRIEEVMEDPKRALGATCQRIGLEMSDSLSYPSWNGSTLEEVAPWGTIRTPTPEVNRATAFELSEDERTEVAVRAGPYLEALDYDLFLGG